MTEYKPIENVLERLVDGCDWAHSFISEFYLITSRRLVELIDDRGARCIGDSDGPYSLRIVIACARQIHASGIEFLFRGLKVFSVQKLDELDFTYSYNRHDGHHVQFVKSHADAQCWVIAEHVSVRFIGHSQIRGGLQLGFEFPNENVVEARVVESSWRQCGSCVNIWDESLRIEFSRCPACGKLTKLRRES